MSDRYAPRTEIASAVRGMADELLREVESRAPAWLWPMAAPFIHQNIDEMIRDLDDPDEAERAREALRPYVLRLVDAFGLQLTLVEQP